MFDKTKYENQVPYPHSPKRPATQFRMTAAEGHAYAKAMEEYEASIPQYEVDLKAYKAEESRIRRQFKADCIENAGLTDHPNADNIYSHFYDENRSEGFWKVWEALEEVASLFDKGSVK